MITMTRHARLERASRIEKIIDTYNGDFGEPIAEHYHAEAYQVLYSTGIVMIFPNQHKQHLITMYIATRDEVLGIYKTAHKVSNVPTSVYRMAQKVNKIANKINNI